MNGPRPAPRSVELVAHDPRWAAMAAEESVRLMNTLGSKLVAVHHIGSTAIPGIIAKPVIDLVPVVVADGNMDDTRAPIEALGYEWWGENGLPGRRFCTSSDAASGRRFVHAHFYADGSPEITRHLAFRDYLRANPAIAAAYEAEKMRCRNLHPQDSGGYSICKRSLIDEVEQRAIAWYFSSGLSPG